MPLYKYVSANSAKKILQQKTLRWSTPLSFNDPFDGQYDQHIEFEMVGALSRIEDELWSIYTRQKEPASLNKLGLVFKQFREKLPALSRYQVFEGPEGLRPAIKESMNKTVEALPPVHASIRKIISATKVLCLSEVSDNLLMWSHYAKDHTGAVLEFSTDDPTPKNIFAVAEPIDYRKVMPRMLNEDDLVAMLSGQFEIDREKVWKNAILVKAEDWAYERERRIYLTNSEPDKDHIYKDFDAEQLTTIFYGCRIADAERSELASYCKSGFPHARQFCAKRSERAFALDMIPYSEG
jgi:hypothetical protein